MYVHHLSLVPCGAGAIDRKIPAVRARNGDRIRRQIKDNGMALVKWALVCGVAIGALAWVVSWNETFTVVTETTVGRPSHEVYGLIADLRNHVRFHPYVRKETELLHTATADDGVELRTFRTEEFIPIPFGFHIPIAFETLVKLTKPNKEFVIEFYVGGVKGKSAWTLDAVGGAAGDGSSAPPGTLVREALTLECMWITRGFVEEKATSAHQEVFRNLKEQLDAERDSL